MSVGQSEAIDNKGFLAGRLLLAMPGIGDPRFNRAVIFICAHDQKGAMGLVVNQERNDMVFFDLLTQLNIASDIKINANMRSLPVMRGGPVEAARGFLLHSPDFAREETINVDKQFSVTGTVEALKAVALGKGPDKALFLLGYAGWESGQLEQEILQNAWLVADPDQDVIFHKDATSKWQMAVSGLGFDPSMLSANSGHA
ncbi:MAG: YqgE/AlgH family protein [Alphaproteobacteria bacterium]|nr:YqgE/AlgH family protein [Alphaproteobacteria bacterium]